MKFTDVPYLRLGHKWQYTTQKRCATCGTYQYREAFDWQECRGRFYPRPTCKHCTLEPLVMRDILTIAEELQDPTLDWERTVNLGARMIEAVVALSAHRWETK